MIEGGCLCGDVAFRIDATALPLYRCHCSICRRASGGGASAATIVPRARFVWASGEDRIVGWRRPTGYRGDFCGRCGAPVPNPIGGERYVWVPAGALEANATANVVVHLCAASRPAWDDAPLTGKVHEGSPGLEALVRNLGIGSEGPDGGAVPPD